MMNQVLTSWLLATSPRFERLVETSLCRVFCFLVVVLLLSHRFSPHARGAISRSTDWK